MNNKLQPLIKWAGGKEQELKYIIPCLPKRIENYYEPFIGGGALYFYINKKTMFINDKSNELINLYNMVKENNKSFFEYVEQIIKDWDYLQKIIENNKIEILHFYKDNFIDVKNWINLFINKNVNILFFKGLNISNENMYINELNKGLYNKLIRMKKIEQEKGFLIDKDILDNFECALKGSYYMYIRNLYNCSKENNSYHASLFFFIRNYSYSGMFRYNKNNEFNVPYGGIGYNSKSLNKKLDYFKSQELITYLNKTNIDNLDFLDFFIKNNPKENDFIFLDPPYDSEFSTYANNEFTKDDQTRLANYLINDCKANWMIVIKNTDFIFNLYNKKNIYINSFNKKYLVSFKNRNDKNVQHLMITNYKVNENSI